MRALLLLLVVIGFGCSPTSYTRLEGRTMGTTFHITVDLDKIEGINSLLDAINQEVNTYDPASVISHFNKSQKDVSVSPDRMHFWTNWMVSEEVYKSSAGFFDPTIMPLVNYWGFGPEMTRPVNLRDSSAVDSLKQFIGFEKLKAYPQKGRLVKGDDRMQLDFSAVAKGYAADAVGTYLSSIGAANYLVEIGGEVVVRGYNEQGRPWTLAINEPFPDAPFDSFVDMVSLSGMAMASSGNYRNYIDLNGVRYGHTLNPISGFPAKTDLLAVSILAKKCSFADAYATACMAMGYEKAQTFINNLDDVEAAFYLAAGDGSLQKKYSNGFIQYRRKGG